MENDKLSNRPISSKTQAQRLFTAIALPDGHKQKLRQWAEQDLKELSFRKWSDYRDYHVTLQFLGDVATSDIPKLEQALVQATAEHAPFTLGIGEAGFFGREQFPRVLWRGVTGQRESLDQLFHSILRATEPLGFKPEERPYRPHITVARSYTGQQPAPSSVWQPNDRIAEPWEVGEFVLYATRLGQKPMYQIIQTFPLLR
ncbi:RNA 2',3'-cyclic phosphodiesterase [Paenibacillus sp. BJ-4]|uniref:RNA 2',3'-cyclic phosphodiesterase n=1 Tax=Paenibacillus sp. BJ-4 TaxID=2878097 RepID=UPI001CF0B0BC|nr:RNA 2',3'-cyclic phosphodiesterase [Paenibacillus sp. BJ-4]